MDPIPDIKQQLPRDPNEFVHNPNIAWMLERMDSTRRDYFLAGAALADIHIYQRTDHRRNTTRLSAKTDTVHPVAIQLLSTIFPDFTQAARYKVTINNPQYTIKVEKNSLVDEITTYLSNWRKKILTTFDNSCLLASLGGIIASGDGNFRVIGTEPPNTNGGVDFNLNFHDQVLVHIFDNMLLKPNSSNPYSLAQFCNPILQDRTRPTSVLRLRTVHTLNLAIELVKELPILLHTNPEIGLVLKYPQSDPDDLRAQYVKYMGTFFDENKVKNR